VAAAGIRNFDVTGGASGGGVVAFPINDLAPPLFGRPNGVGTGRRSDFLCPPRLRGLRLALRVGMGYRRGADDAATHDGLGADQRPHGE